MSKLKMRNLRGELQGVYKKSNRTPKKATPVIYFTGSKVRGVMVAANDKNNCIGGGVEETEMILQLKMYTMPYAW